MLRLTLFIMHNPDHKISFCKVTSVMCPGFLIISKLQCRVSCRGCSLGGGQPEEPPVLSSALRMAAQVGKTFCLIHSWLLCFDEHMSLIHSFPFTHCATAARLFCCDHQMSFVPLCDSPMASLSRWHLPLHCAAAPGFLGCDHGMSLVQSLNKHAGQTQKAQAGLYRP